MWETTVWARQAREIRSSPEQVWSLLASPALWSLRPNRYAFDAASADQTLRFRVVLGIRRSGGLGVDVFEVTDEEPSHLLTLSRVSLPRAVPLAFDLSAEPSKRGTKAAITVQERVNRWVKSETQSRWRKQLKTWLAECAAALEGRRQWPAEELPADIREACMSRCSAEEMEEAVSVSASAVISAPPDRTWQLLWDPATCLLVNPDNIAAGRIPGTPSRQIGEVQYCIHRHSDGSLHASLVAVDELDDGRTALVHDITTGGMFSEIYHQVEPDGHGTLLTLTRRVLHAAAADHRQAVEMKLAELVDRYKSAIETPTSGQDLRRLLSHSSFECLAC